MLGLIAAIYKETGKQEMYLKRRPEELEKLVKIAKIKSAEASNAIEEIVTTGTRIRQLALEKTTPKNRDEQEIAGYRDVLSIILESFDAIPITQNYILQLHRVLYSYMNNPVAGRTKTVQNYIAASYLCPSLSDSSIEGALRKLVASGELKREGKGKNTCYLRLNTLIIGLQSTDLE